MRFDRVFFIAVILTYYAGSHALAGGAAARRKMGNPQAQQQMQQQQQLQQMRQKQLIEAKKQVQAQQAALDAQREPDEVIAFETLWDELAASGEIWTRLMDDEIKMVILTTYIDWYRQQGIVLQKHPGEYIILLDSMALHNADMFERPFADVLRMVAIMEYDFNNGMNKDQMVLSIFGKDFYEQNKKRLGR